MAEWYVKRGKMTDNLHNRFGERLAEFAKLVGQDLLEHLNPSCNLGKKIDKKDKISFEVDVSTNGQRWGGKIDYRVFKSSAYATAHKNGSDDVFFPIKVEVEIEPFSFRELERRERGLKIQNLQQRLRDLPKKFRKAPVANGKKRAALLSITRRLNHIEVDMFDEDVLDDIIEYFDQAISELEKEK